MTKNLWLYNTRKTTTDKCIVFDFDELQAHTYSSDAFDAEIDFNSAFNNPETLHFRNYLYKIDYDDFSEETTCPSWGVLRPGFFDFLNFCFNHFKIVAVWSAGTHDYVHSVLESVWFSANAPHVTFTRNECVDMCISCKGYDVETLFDSQGEYVWVCRNCKAACEYCSEMTEKEILIESELDDEHRDKCQCKYNIAPCIKPLEKFWKHPVWGKYMNAKNTIIIDDKRSVYKYCNPDNGIQVPLFEPHVSLAHFSDLFQCKCGACVKAFKVNECDSSEDSDEEACQTKNEESDVDEDDNNEANDDSEECNKIEEEEECDCDECNVKIVCTKQWKDPSFHKLILFFQSPEFIECEDVRKLDKTNIFTATELEYNN